MEFKKLRGNRVYLELPPKDEESKLIVDENTKEALQKELLKKMSKLKVYAVGDLVTDIVPGDDVLVDPSALSKTVIVPLSNEKDVLLVSPFDIIHVW
jgi:hypothetical protein